MFITRGIVACFRNSLGLYTTFWSAVKISTGMLDFTSDLVFISLLDPQEPVRFGIALSSCVLSTGLSYCVARSYNENFFLLLTSSLDAKRGHDETAAQVNRLIVLFVEDIPFLGLEISLVVQGKKLRGLDWVIWGQSFAFTLINMIRNAWSWWKARQRMSSVERATELAAVVQLGAQVIA